MQKKETCSNDEKEPIVYKTEDVQDLRGAHQIALLYFIIEKMGPDDFFTPEDVKAKMTERQTITCATINSFLVNCVLDGFFICKAGKYKSRVRVV